MLDSISKEKITVRPNSTDNLQRLLSDNVVESLANKNIDFDQSHTDHRLYKFIANRTSLREMSYSKDLQFVPNKVFAINLMLLSCVSGLLPTSLPIYIQVFKTGGFRASISPNGPQSAHRIDGVQLFVFHANVNGPIRLPDVGQYSGAVTKPDGDGHWTYRNNSLKLNINDVINYWAYIQVNNIGYKIGFRSFIVYEQGY